MHPSAAANFTRRVMQPTANAAASHGPPTLASHHHSRGSSYTNRVATPTARPTATAKRERKRKSRARLKRLAAGCAGGARCRVERTARVGGTRVRDDATEFVVVHE